MTTANYQQRMKGIQEGAASDRAAAVRELLSVRGDLSGEQRARLAQIGMTEGVATLQGWLRDVVPPPQSAGSPATLKASGDPHMDRLFKIMPEASEGNGFTAGDRSDGTLCRASIIGALATIRAATKANVAMAKSKMGIGDRGQR